MQQSVSFKPYGSVGFSRLKALAFVLFATIFTGIVLFYPYHAASAADVQINPSATTLSTIGSNHLGVDSKIVFTSDTKGYAFYRVSGGTLVYVTTVNGGTSWSGSATTVNSANTHIEKVSVWYDRWTPGNTTGNIIHILSRDSSNGTSDLYYNEIDTGNSDAVSSTINLTNGGGGPTKTNSFFQDSNFPTISVGTTGVVYAAVADGNAAGDQSYVLKCSSSCTTLSNWSDANANLGDAYPIQRVIRQL
jgi:hypothetical protein